VKSLVKTDLILKSSMAATTVPSTLDKVVLQRHSTRKFLSTPVPRSILEEALTLASHSPSNSNIQPWRLYLASGPGLERIRTSLMTVAQQGPPKIPPLPEKFRHKRSELGKKVYGEGMGIAYDDISGRTAAVMRNFEFFGAPVAGVLCIHRDLGPVDTLGAGMYLQTLLLALTEHGLESSVEVSVIGYPDVLRKEMGIDEEMNMICGIAIGHEDPSFSANKLHIGRDAIEKTTIFIEE
jgi:nitroreductase